jgi:hypothetical protein
MTKGPKLEKTKKKDGFTMAIGQKKNPPRKKNPDTTPKITTKHSYDILNQPLEDEDIQDPHKVKNQEKGKIQAAHTSTQSKEANQEDKMGENGDTQMQLDEQDLADIYIEKLEEALNRKDLQTIPIEQLRKVHKVFLDSTAGSTSRLDIAIDPSTDSKRILW